MRTMGPGIKILDLRTRKGMRCQPHRIFGAGPEYGRDIDLQSYAIIRSKFHTTQ